MQDYNNGEIKDEAILDDLIKLLDLTPTEKEILASLQATARIIAPALSEAFYDRLFTYPLTAKYLADQIEKRKELLAEWFVQLFSGHYDRDYIHHRLKIGRFQVQTGLPIRYPLAIIDLIVEFGLVITEQSSHPEHAAAALRKLLALDIAIFNQAYEDTQLEYLAKIMGHAHLARRILSG